MANYSSEESTPLSPVQEVPLPPVYQTKVAYTGLSQNEISPPPTAHSFNTSYTGASTDQEDEPDAFYQVADSKRESFRVEEVESQSLGSNYDFEEVKRSKNLVPLYVLVLISNSRYYIRGVAILVMIIAVVLILIGVGRFAAAKRSPDFNSIPKPAPITDQPCIVFTGIAVMNLVLSSALLLTSCISSKFRKSNNVLSAVFTIISAIGFSTSMGACFFLNRETTLQNDLWKWSCGNQKAGIQSPALDFGEVCSVIAFSWRFGLLQASLELLTFIISCTACFLGRYFNLGRHGHF